MPMTNKRYTATAIALHWLVAALIAGAFVIGLIAVELAVSPQKLKLYSRHKWTRRFGHPGRPRRH